MSRAQDGKCLLAWMREHKHDEYGAVFLGDAVREVLGIRLPAIAEKKVFDQAALTELTAVDYCRNVLLGEGKYLSQHQGDYRILLPSENERQIRQYMSSADSKLRRGMKLSRNTPQSDESYRPDNNMARMLLKREAIRAARGG